MSPSGLFSWGTQNHPEFLLKRNAIAVALAASESASEDPPQDKSFDGRMLKAGLATLPSGEQITVHLNPNRSWLPASRRSTPSRCLATRLLSTSLPTIAMWAD